MRTFSLVFVDYLREVAEVVLIGFVITVLFSADSLGSLALGSVSPGQSAVSRQHHGPSGRGSRDERLDIRAGEWLMGSQTATLYGASVVILAALLGLTLNLAVA